MKRILTLFITALMLFSIFSAECFAASSYEAELLSALSIMQGDPNGNMRYEDKVSRAECAKIVVAASDFRNSVDLSSKKSPHNLINTHEIKGFPLSLEIFLASNIGSLTLKQMIPIIFSYFILIIFSVIFILFPLKRSFFRNSFTGKKIPAELV